MITSLSRRILKGCALSLIVVAFIFGCAAPQVDKQTTGKKPILERGERQQIKIGKKRRRFYVYTPSSYDGKQPVPLVFDFHGSGGNPRGEVGYSDSANLAEKKGFILVALDGIYSRKSWNTAKDPKGVDDIGFIKQVLGIITGKYNIDKNMIYALGMSGGARMSSRIGCDLADTFAAIAPVAGVQFLDDCSPSRAVPVITFHGKKDLVNHYTHRSNSRPYWIHGVEDSVDKWVKANGCNPTPQSTKISKVVTKLNWIECRDGADVVFYQIEDGGHTWPGSPVTLTAGWAGKTNKDIVAIDLIWEFFVAHPMI